MRTLRLTLAALAFVAVACSDSGTPTGVVQPGGPSFDGSGMVGSGNATSTSTESDSTVTTRGSGMVGSGN